MLYVVLSCFTESLLILYFQCSPAPPLQFLSFACSCQQNYGQIIGFCPKTQVWRPP